MKSQEAEEVPQKVLSLDDIMKADDVEYAYVPGFKPGEVFRIRSVTAGDMIEWQEANTGDAKKTAGLRLIVKSLVDPKGELIMNNEHLPILRKKTHKVTNALVDAILKHNGMQVKNDKSTGEENAKKD